jgi:hypothetical protein
MGIGLPIPADLEKKLTTTVQQMQGMNALLVEIRDLLTELIEIQAKQLARMEDSS